jgi:hypothetical protein
VIGLGLGLAMATAMGTATLGVRSDDAGVASATVNTMQQIGGSIGTALLSTAAASATSSYAASPTTATDAMAQAAVHGYTTAVWWSAAIFAAGAIVCGLLMRPGRRRSTRPPSPCWPTERSGPPASHSGSRALPTRGISSERRRRRGTHARRRPRGG